MLFINKKKVDEDVEKIRHYYMSPEQLHQELEQEKKDRDKIKENLEGFGFKDVVAMTIAIIEVLLPYLLAFIGTMVLVYAFFWYMAHR